MSTRQFYLDEYGMLPQWMIDGYASPESKRIDHLKRLVADYRSGWDESSVGIEPVTIEDILKAVEAL